MRITQISWRSLLRSEKDPVYPPLQLAFELSIRHRRTRKTRKRLNMNAKFISLGIMLSAAWLASSVHSQLITNGNFSTLVPRNSTGGGWTSSHIDGAGGHQPTGGNPGGNFILNDTGPLGSDPTISQSVSGLTPGGSYLLTGDYASVYSSFGVATKLSFAVDIDGLNKTKLGRPGAEGVWGSFAVPFWAAASSALISFRAEIDGDDSSYRIDNIDLIGCPVINGVLSATATVGQPFIYWITASNYRTSFTATVPPPAGLTLDTTTGKISGTPTACGTFSIALRAANACGTATAMLTLDVGPPPPVITSALSQTATAGQPFTYDMTATNSPTSFTATIPTGVGLTFTPGTSTTPPKISGTPTVCNDISITLIATNACGTDNKVLTLGVPSTPPVITSALSQTATAGQPFTYDMTATNSPTSFTATIPTGVGLTFTPGTSTTPPKISGTPTVCNDISITLIATNACGTDNQVLTLTVPSTPPVITSALSQTATALQPFTYNMTATNSPTSFTATFPPALNGLTFTPATKIIDGAPSPAGTFSIDLSATNACGTGTAVLMLKVDPPPDQIPLPKGSIVISPLDFPYKVTVEMKCTEAIGSLCLSRVIVRTCIGGNYCFDMPRITHFPCIKCLLGASVAIGAGIGVVGAILLMRYGRDRP
jgi:hypothetical protein